MDDAAKAVILVVDDSATCLHAMTIALRENYETLVATSGDRALELLARHPSVDLVLLDINMPGMGGFEVCQQLKQNPRTASIPVIFLTATDDPDEVERAFAVGGADLLDKACVTALLLARLSSHLRISALERTLAQLRGSAT